MAIDKTCSFPILFSFLTIYTVQLLEQANTGIVVRYVQQNTTPPTRKNYRYGLEGISFSVISCLLQ